ncbi:hypothetical protein BS78_01G023400 [Paspalum vaginatum]|nr:hypothetical protein BS78_01G023400 [Paspalum vaginatum]
MPSHLDLSALSPPPHPTPALCSPPRLHCLLHSHQNFAPPNSPTSSRIRPVCQLQSSIRPPKLRPGPPIRPVRCPAAPPPRHGSEPPRPASSSSASGAARGRLPPLRPAAAPPPSSTSPPPRPLRHRGPGSLSVSVRRASKPASANVEERDCGGVER